MGMWPMCHIGPHAQWGHTWLMFCCSFLEVSNNFWIRGSYKLCKQSYLYGWCFFCPVQGIFFLIPSSWMYAPVLFSSGFNILFSFLGLPGIDLVCLCDQWGVRFHFCLYGYLIDPALFIYYRDHPFTTALCYYFCIRSLGVHMCVGFFWGSYSVLLFYLSSSQYNTVLVIALYNNS